MNDHAAIGLGGKEELADAGDISEAILHYSEASRLKPRDASTKVRLGVLLAQQGQIPEATDEFLAAYNSWLKGPFSGAIALLHELSTSFHLACLSNMSQSHWERLLDDARSRNMIGKFRHRFVSFEMGRMKPDRCAFDHVLEHMPFPPERIVFFDDNRECVETARNLGLRAFEVRGIAAIRAALASIGIEITGDVAA